MSSSPPTLALHGDFRSSNRRVRLQQNDNLVKKLPDQLHHNVMTSTLAQTFELTRRGHENFTLYANALLDISNECAYGRGRYYGNMAPEVSIDQWRKGSQWF
ncbi:hypothetical protein AtNW77_Chr5g0110761 [Arabidopsis thaliana]|uniref:Uncharacterized protein n=2 Tax=Arabidopsis TaxID=3701 RepID=A0A5S9Y796_ARATH|nr:hypothetical protein ISN45_At05g024600 [Arabidopsis thaliana x Arabidopsis arenosa]CAA0404884.1 unnamed protein product [Arabidopsis thaliana]